MAPHTTPVWFITGCSSGFGHELAKLVLARGWRAVVTARDKSRVAELASNSHADCLALDLDVTDTRQIGAAVNAAHARFGRIDVLVNNAGYGYQASVEEGEDAQIREMFDADVFGLFAMTRAVLPGMRTNRSGHVLNISSVAGLEGVKNHGAYAGTKWAIRGLTKVAAQEWGRNGIRVNSVHPGLIETPMTAENPAVHNPEVRARFERGLSLGRMGTSRDIANMVLFLASDESSYCTGQEFVVDGGIHH